MTLAAAGTAFAVLIGVLVVARRGPEGPDGTTSPDAGGGPVLAEPGLGTRFVAFGDFGDASPEAAAVSDLVDRVEPDFVVTTGDNAYDGRPLSTTVGELYGDYLAPPGGRNRFFASIGNHDVDEGGGLPAYLEYFDLPGPGATSRHPSGNERYYDVVQGPVHLFILSSHPDEPDGRTATSAQAAWLEAGLAGSTAPWQIVVLHNAPFSSATEHGSNAEVQWPFEAWGVDLVLAGHDHVYERLLRDDDDDGVALPYVVTGMGGSEAYDFTTVPEAGSVVRHNAEPGALIVEADGSMLAMEFRDVEGRLVDGHRVVRPGTIAGVVTDDERRAVQGVRIVVSDRSGSVVARTTTDSRGVYVATVPPGTFELSHRQDRVRPLVEIPDPVVVGAGGVAVDIAVST